MNLDFGSGVLDVLFALAFIYFLLSVIVSAGTEAISWFLQQRAKTLENGLKTLFSDPTGQQEVTKQLLEHPRMKGAMKKRKFCLLPKANLPSYVSSRNFALALTDVFTQSGKGLDNVILDLPNALKAQLRPLLPVTNIDKFRTSVEKWYDDAMEQVSGRYKRWAQLVTIMLAVAVTVAFNVDTLRVANRLYTDEVVRQSIVQAGETTLTKHAGKSSSEKPGTGHSGSQAKPRVATSPTKAGEEAEEAAVELTSLKLPIGWDAVNANFNLASAAGWLLTAIAISLGAPFWFDALGRLARLRATGGKPQPK
jgi:hypothetical protein